MDLAVATHGSDRVHGSPVHLCFGAPCSPEGLSRNVPAQSPLESGRRCAAFPCEFPNRLVPSQGWTRRRWRCCRRRVCGDMPPPLRREASPQGHLPPPSTAGPATYIRWMLTRARMPASISESRIWTLEDLLLHGKALGGRCHELLCHAIQDQLPPPQNLGNHAGVASER